MAGQARRGVLHGLRAKIAGVVLGNRKITLTQNREIQVGRAEIFLPRDQVAERAVHHSQAPGEARVRDDVSQVLARGVPLGDLDLFEYKIQVFRVKGQIGVYGLCRCDLG